MTEKIVYTPEKTNETVLRKKERVTYLTFSALDIYQDKLVNAFSTRRGGFSKGIYKSMNLGLNHQDSKENVLFNYMAFAKAIGPGCPAYCSRFHPRPEAAIAAIHAAGGVAVMAHPRSWTNDPFALRAGLAKLKDAGLDGIEAVYQANPPGVTLDHLMAAKELGLAVSAGSGIDDIFHNFSVDHIISGGQTMNPSIDTIVNAIGRCNARNVFVLPNNSNIILAAQQAKNLCSCNVIVLPTKTIPQGIAAAMAFNPDLSVEENETNMNDAVSEIVSGAVTYAIRETHFNGIDIKEGDLIGIMDSDIAAVTTSVNSTVKELVSKMIEKRDIEDPIVNLYYGDNVEEEEANALTEELQEMFEDAEFIVAKGGQPLYYYYLSVE